MHTLIAITVFAAGSYALALAGYLLGKDAHYTRIWAEGYAAGLAKADEMWPEVKRWEMQ